MLVPLGVAAAVTVVGVLFAPWLLGLATLRSVDAPTRSEELRVGLVASVAALPTAGALAIGAVVLGTVPSEASPLVAALVIAIASVGSAAVTPLIAVAPSLARCGGSTSDALARALHRCAQLGPSSACLGAAYGACLALGAAAFVVACAAFGIGWLAVPGFFGAAAVGTGFGVLALSLGAALGEPSSGDDAALRYRALAMPSIIALVGTAALVLVVPAPMATPVGDDVVARHERIDPWVFEALDRGHALLAIAREGRIVDYVRLPPLHETDWQDGGWPVEVHRSGDGFVVVTWGRPGGPSLGAVYDAQGQRLDDTLVDRVLARTSGGSVLAALLAIVLGVVASRRARGAAAWSVDGPVVLDVIVRGDGTRLEAIDGSAVVTLDRKLPSLCTSLQDGARVRIVSPTRIALGPREGATTAPAGAWLLDADVDPKSARTSFLAQRVALPLIGAILALLLAASGVLILL